MLWEAIPMALVAAFSPTTLVVVASLLGRERPLALALSFYLTAAALSLAVGFLLLGVLAGSGLDNKKMHPTVPAALDLTFGVVILLFALWIARRPPATPKEAKQRDMRLLTAVALGLVIGSPSPMYLASVHSLSKGGPGLAARSLGVILLTLIVLLMAELPIITFLIAPERTHDALKSANAWLSRNGHVIALAAATVVGCYFTVIGIVGLL